MINDEWRRARWLAYMTIAYRKPPPVSPTLGDCVLAPVRRQSGPDGAGDFRRIIGFFGGTGSTHRTAL